jgi:hypothetical protein
MKSEVKDFESVVAELVDDASWTIQWSQNADGHRGFTIVGYQPKAGNVSVFVDGLLLVSRHCGEKFKIKVRRIKRMKAKQTLLICNQCGIIPFDETNACRVAPRFKKGRGFRDLKREILLGKYLSKKDGLTLPFIMREEHKQRYFHGYHFLNTVFRQRFDKELLLTHGTLLGIIRNGDLIESDDDFDCAYVSDLNNPEDVSEELYEVGDRFQRLGFNVKYSRTGHLKLNLGDCEYDVMPAWHDSSLFHISSYTSIPMDPAHTAPTGRVDYRGTDVSCVANPETFLELNYGESWRHPDPDYKSAPNPVALANRRIFQNKWRAQQ